MSPWSRGVLIGSNPGSGGAGGAVTSVAGRTGAVVLTAADVGAGQLPAGVLLPSGVVIPTGASATTQAANDNSTKVATTAYADAIAALKANLASPTFTGTVTLPSGLVLPSNTTAVTQAASDNSTKVATTAYADAIAALKANLASPTFTGTPLAPTPAANDNSTKIATTAAMTAQDKLSGGVNQIGPNTFSNFPYYLTGSQIASPNAGDGRWLRVMMAQTGTLHDISFLVNTTGGNYNIIVLDDGQANATHTTRTCLGLKGSTATPAASAYITYDVNIAVNAGDTLVFMLTFDGTAAKVGASTGSLGGIALPASFFPGSGAATTASKICGTCLAASVPGSVGATVTDANMVAAANAPFCAWRIS